ncbi:hypothetical protein THRCLA_09784 [Thraustotheca clavata]|uniref:NmrA-like domain-containing protein n=1 Tax=Thraustotheca clavata TaxID=74557 RepID=A0A1V9YUE5_9STRA|nr:hypothetical protein THRCLA_09784 [Thraustotheca clavata]
MGIFVNGTSLFKPSSAAGALGRLVLSKASVPYHVATARVDYAQAIVEGRNAKALVLSAKADELAETMKRSGSNGLLLLPDAVDPSQWDATLKMLEAAQLAKLQHLILVSTAASAENSIVPSGKAWFKLECEAEKSNIPLTILHPTTLMQSFLHGNMHDMICGRTLSVTNNAAKIAFIDGYDVAQVINSVVAKPTENSSTYHLTGPAALSWQEVAATFSKHLCSPVHYSKFPLWAVQTSMWVKGKRPEEIQEVVNLSKYYEAQYESDTSNTIRELLGREPRSFDEFVKEHEEEWPLQKFA